MKYEQWETKCVCKMKKTKKQNTYMGIKNVWPSALMCLFVCVLAVNFPLRHFMSFFSLGRVVELSSLEQMIGI